MRTIKFLSNIFLTFCAIGIVFSIAQQHYVNRILSVLIFSISIVAIIWVRKNRPEKLWTILMIVSIMQLFSFKIGLISYKFIVGTGLISYFDAKTFRHQTDLFQLSTFNFFTPLNESDFVIGVNFLAAAMITYLFYIKQKRNLKTTI